jgi:hypothetical protein
MKDAEEADLRPEILGIASDFEQGLGAGTEEQAVEEPLVLQGEGCQPMREGEDEVGGRGRQDFPATRLDPTVAGVGLHLGQCPQREHSSKCPPRAAVRQCWMAARTLRCCPVSQWRLRWMNFCPAVRIRSATSRGGRLI